MTEAQSLFDRVVKSRLQSRLPPKLLQLLVIAIFSVFYFVGTYLRASEKYFWYDELFTLYICRLPSFHASWTAVLHGADFNPPLFYALTRLSNFVVGEGLVGTRLPAIIGFWIFSLCLFRFVKRESGLLAGFVAMTFPLFTFAYNYAYEARPPGIVLCFCGLALIFWQLMQERPSEARWLILFGLSLGAAFLSHCYAVTLIAPFAIAEAFSTFHSHRLRWGPWAAMIAPIIASIIVIVPLLQSYNRIVQGTSWAQGTVATFGHIAYFYTTLLTTSLTALVLLSLLLLLSMCLSRHGEHLSNVPIRPAYLVLTVGFLALPVFGVLLGKLVQGPFVPRYVISAVVGFAVLTGFAVDRSRPNWVRIVLVCVVALSLTQNFLALIVDRYVGPGGVVLAPGSGHPVNTRARGPMASHHMLTFDSSSALPIVVPNGIEYLYLAHYDAAQRARLYYVGDLQRDTFIREYRLLRELCGLPFNRERAWNEFLLSNPEFLVYGNVSSMPWFFDHEQNGGVLKSIKFQGDRFLADVQRSPIR
jgi:4-amino-4-deoxy-L-arabinose transferase-like glycosyltransferase